MKSVFSSDRSSTKISFFTNILIAWFNINGRKFPWRIERDPFKILIAEFMLQRTRANQVLPVYTEFIERFPGVTSINTDKLSEISHFISRLGLTWRTETIVKAIQELRSKHNGKVPSNKRELLALPGVGDYISDTLMVFGHNERITVVDANVVRLVSRFFGIKMKGEVRRKKEFVNFCQTLIEKVLADQIKNFNWALIDFPAAICIKNPRCKICPLSERCSYFAKNLKTGSDN